MQLWIRVFVVVLVFGATLVTAEREKKDPPDVEITDITSPDFNLVDEDGYSYVENEAFQGDHFAVGPMPREMVNLNTLIGERPHLAPCVECQGFEFCGHLNGQYSPFCRSKAGIEWMDRMATDVVDQNMLYQDWHNRSETLNIQKSILTEFVCARNVFHPQFTCEENNPYVFACYKECKEIFEGIKGLPKMMRTENMQYNCNGRVFTLPGTPRFKSPFQRSDCLKPTGKYYSDKWYAQVAKDEAYAKALEEEKKKKQKQDL